MEGFPCGQQGLARGGAVTRRWQAWAAALALAALAGVVGAWLGARGARAAGADPGSSADPLVSKSYVDQYVLFQVVNLARGQRLVADGGTELVVRAGQATAIVSDKGGLSDLTAGRDIQAGEPVPTNHLVLVPRSDGRGLVARTDLVLLVRGTYAVQGP